MIPPLVAIYLWPVATYVLFQRLDFMRALCVSFVAGYLLLPTGVGTKLPLIEINKGVIVLLSVLLMGSVFAYKRPAGRLLPGAWPKIPAFTGLVALIFVGILLTIVTNSDALIYGPRRLPSLGVKDLILTWVNTLVRLAPLVIAWKFLGSDEGNAVLLRVIVFALAAYGMLALYEVRMSPQLNNMVYGFFPHSWLQHKRAGGFRPLVFLPHGLILGILLSMATVGAAGLMRFNREGRGRYIALLVYMLVVLVLSKTLGALAIALLLVPVALLLPARLQILVAAALALMIVAYPALRNLGLVPVDSLVSFASGIDTERAGSLKFRFDHENAILDKASERSLAGWGSWSRWRIYDEFGRDISVSDGFWVILFGEGGWLRYIGQFGVYILPILLLALRARKTLSPATGVLALMLTANLIDLLPNAGISSITALLAGALLGNYDHHRRGSALAPTAAGADPSAQRQVHGYTRYPARNGDAPSASRRARPHPKSNTVPYYDN